MLCLLLHLVRTAELQIPILELVYPLLLLLKNLYHLEGLHS
jgi:hypothetical protein